MENESEATCREYVKKKVKKPELIEAYFNTALPVFGGITAIEFAEKHGWNEVMGVLRRILS